MTKPRHPSASPVNLSPKAGSLPSFEEHMRLCNLKRTREDETAVGDAPELKRRFTVAQDVVYRIVVPSRQIGRIIGREGHRIKKIREEFKATIRIVDAIARHEDRGIIISSEDSESERCDAELALHHIVGFILKDDGVGVETQQQAAGHVTACTIRLLIAGSQAGGLIGFNGQNIENLRNDSGATITVQAKNQLPLCASILESGRVVQISGDAGSVQKAVMKIGFQLRNNLSEQVIPTKQSHNQQVDQSSAPYLEIKVPEELVGGLIGRSGSNISRIRTESGATIKVNGRKGEKTERKILLGGDDQQVSLARQRIDEYVYYQMLQSGKLSQMSSITNEMFQANNYPQTNLFQSDGLNVNSNNGKNVMPVHSGVDSNSSKSISRL